MASLIARPSLGQQSDQDLVWNRKAAAALQEALEAQKNNQHQRAAEQFSACTRYARKLQKQDLIRRCLPAALDSRAYVIHSLLTDGRARMAFLQSRKAISLDSTSSQAYFWYAMTLSRLQQNDRAVKNYNRAVEIVQRQEEPDSLSVFSRLNLAPEPVSRVDDLPNLPPRPDG